MSKCYRRFLVLLLSAWAFAAVAQNVADTVPVSLTIQALSYSDYPSMVPTTAIRVHLGDKADIADLVTAPENANWDCSKTSSYTVTVKGSNDTKPRSVAISEVHVEPDNKCRPVDTGRGITDNVFLVLRGNNFDAKASFVVSLQGLAKGSAQSAATTIKGTVTALGFTLTPQAAPDETLTNGVKRDVGQLSINLTDPQLIPSFRSASVYLNSADLFSTDEKDAKSAFSGTLGLKRGLSGRWYTPLNLQQTVQGNQVATNFSAVSTMGFATILPWAWNKHFLYNDYFLKIPNPPEFTVNISYTHRFAQLTSKKTTPLAADDFSLNPAMTLAPIYPFSRACNSLKSKLASIGQKKDSGMGGASSSSPNIDTPKQYCLAVQLDLGMWYLPLDLTKSGSQQAEGYGDASLLVPVSDLPFNGLGALIAGVPNAQLRIKYSDSVNAANNYARTRQWTFGFEVIK